MANGILSGPMFESSAGSVFHKEGAHYNIFAVKEEEAMDLLRRFFPKGEANDLNFVLFSTSGVHGSYTTIEEARRGKCAVTFVIVQPRLVCMRYGNVAPKTDDDWAFLKKLRASSWAAVQTIGAPPRHSKGKGSREA